MVESIARAGEVGHQPGELLRVGREATARLKAAWKRAVAIICIVRVIFADVADRLASLDEDAAVRRGPRPASWRPSPRTAPGSC